MRKNLLIGLSQREAPVSAEAARADYANRGASRSMIQSIEEMAENAKRMMEGEAIVALDTGLIDASFVADRMEDDPAEFALFRDGIAKDGQLQPVLVRPHPQAVGRYMVVFGHRRVRAARELGIGVRAVVKNVEAIAHVIAQGQENSRRSNLSFVEKALFAKKLRDMGQGKETVKSALGVDDTLLSRMLAVADGVPTKLVDAIGAAKGVGRDRWEELKKRVLKPADAEKALVIAAEPGFAARDGKGRIEHLLAELRRRGRKRPASASPAPASWAATDGRIAARMHGTAKTYDLSLRAADAAAFGAFLSARLDDLYAAFRAAENRATGD